MKTVPPIPRQGPGDFEPDYAASPGQVLLAELQARGLSQADLAARTGLSAKHVNQVVRDVVPLSAETALLLERTLGVPSRVWNALEAAHRDAVVQAQAQRRLETHGSWLTRFPVKELVRRGVLDEVASVGHRVSQLLAFFRVADPAAWERLYADPVAAFRRAQHLSVDAPATAVWLRLAEQAAEELAATLAPGTYSARTFRRLLPTLRELTLLSDDHEAMAELQRTCADIGVLVVFVPELKGTRINGATRWLGDRPMIALTGRYRYADVLWFSFFHEAGHVLLHPRRGTYISLQASGSDEDGSEKQADEFARDVLIPPLHATRLEQLQAADVPQFAHSLRLDAGIVAGRIGHETGDWARVAPLRRRLSL